DSWTVGASDRVTRDREATAGDARIWRPELEATGLVVAREGYSRGLECNSVSVDSNPFEATVALRIERDSGCDRPEKSGDMGPRIAVDFDGIQLDRHVRQPRTSDVALIEARPELNPDGGIRHDIAGDAHLV